MLNMIVIENYDFVSGTRYANGGKRLGGSLIGHILSLLANKSFCLITRFPLTDLTTGIKMFKKNFYNMNDMNKIEFDKSKTTIAYKKNSFIYDFLFSLRQKIDDPLGKKRIKN